MKEFNIEKEVNDIINFIRDYFKNNNLKGVVLGISGGKDSAVASALFVKALGSENVLGLTLPCESKEEDAKDAKLISDYYNFELKNINLTETFLKYNEEINKLDNYTKKDLHNSNINLKPRLRMCSLYYMAALYSSIKKGTYIVGGTSNKCELFVGYFTKGGDTSYDLGVLNDYTVEEVIKIGEYLQVPEKVLYKKPSDGIEELTDEDKLGVTYKDIAKFINNEYLEEETYNKIKDLHLKNKHKLNVAKFTRK